MKISLYGFGEATATFEADSGVTPGMPVKITGNGAVVACSAKDNFCGVAVSVRDGFAAVQLRGYTVLPYAGTSAPAVGYQTLSAAGGGKVQVDTAGRSILVTDVDTAAQTCGIIL